MALTESIKVNKETKRLLDNLKKHKRESYNEVIYNNIKNRRKKL